MEKTPERASEGLTGGFVGQIAEETAEEYAKEQEIDALYGEDALYLNTQQGEEGVKDETD